MICCMLKKLVFVVGVSVCLFSCGKAEKGGLPKTQCVQEAPLCMHDKATWYQKF